MKKIDNLQKIKIYIIVGIIQLIFMVTAIVSYVVYHNTGKSNHILMSVGALGFGIIAVFLWIVLIIGAAFVVKETHNNNNVILTCLFGGLGASLSGYATLRQLENEIFEEALERAQEKTMEAKLNCDQLSSKRKKKCCKELEERRNKK